MALISAMTFTFLASTGLAIAFSIVAGDSGLILRLVLKALAALTTTLLAIWALRRWSRKLPALAPCAEAPLRPTTPAQRAILLLILCATAIFSFHRLACYPQTWPDELHHLVVARNLGLHGAYASGHPDRGLVYFDTYDSVGPTVIGPIGLLFAVDGVSLGGARAVVACYMLLLCVGVYALIRPRFSAHAALWATACCATAWGTIFLARSLYGEVPALAWLVWGLVLWRRALSSPKPFMWGIAAGLLFGLAVLTKTVLLIGGCVFIGLWLFDAFTHRRLSWKHMAAPALGTILVLAAWMAIQSLTAPEASSQAAGLLMLYRHYFMFGLDALSSLPRILEWQQVFGIFAAACALIYLLPDLLHKRYDPPLILLALLGVFFAFWFAFFTPASIRRYLWYTLAIGGIFSGVFIHTLISQWPQTRRRLLWALPAILILLNSAWLVREQTWRVFVHDAMEDHRALAEYVRKLPPDATMASTWWVVTYLLNFYDGRNVAYLDALDANSQTWPPYDVIVVDEYSQPQLADYLARGPFAQTKILRYAVFQRLP